VTGKTGAVRLGGRKVKHYYAGGGKWGNRSETSTCEVGAEQKAEASRKVGTNKRKSTTRKKPNQGLNSTPNTGKGRKKKREGD